MIIDTHTHLFLEEFDEDRAEVVRRAREAGVAHVCMPNIDMSTVDRLLEMCGAEGDFALPLIGLHPESVKEDYADELGRLQEVFHRDPQRFAGIGEIGLDYYWDRTFEKEQVEAFDRQVRWAADEGLPIVIHSRNSAEAVLEVLDGYRDRGLRGIFHCFSGTTDEARRMLDHPGFVLGIGGIVTFKKSTLPEVLAEAVPPERVVLETDSPYLAPVPHRGKRNESAFLPHTLRKLAEIYGLDEDEMACITTQNACRVFDALQKIVDAEMKNDEKKSAN